jgi:hypothetical protein
VASKGNKAKNGSPLSSNNHHDRRQQPRTAVANKGERQREQPGGRKEGDGCCPKGDPGGSDSDLTGACHARKGQPPEDAEAQGEGLGHLISLFGTSFQMLQNAF